MSFLARISYNPLAFNERGDYIYIQMKNKETESLVLYDGVCALCNTTVKFLLKIDKSGILKFAPLQGETAAGLGIVEESDTGWDSVIFVLKTSTHEFFYKSDAIFACLKEIGGFWGVLAWFRYVPRAIRDMIYGIIARHRYKWFGKYDSCPIPPPEVRQRFLP